LMAQFAKTVTNNLPLLSVLADRAEAFKLNHSLIFVLSMLRNSKSLRSQKNDCYLL